MGLLAVGQSAVATQESGSTSDLPSKIAPSGVFTRVSNIPIWAGVGAIVIGSALRYLVAGKASPRA